MSDVVAQAKAALKGVTPGPWGRHDFGYAGEQEPSSIIIHAGKFDWQAIRDGDFIASTAAWDAQEDRDAEFIAQARTLVPALVAEIERLRAVGWGVGCPGGRER